MKIAILTVVHENYTEYSIFRFCHRDWFPKRISSENNLNQNQKQIRKMTEVDEDRCQASDSVDVHTYSPPIKNAISSSKSICFVGPRIEPDVGSCNCPLGLVTSVPETTIDDALPW
jgi:hypothetical protein